MPRRLPPQQKKAIVNTAKAKATAKNQQCYKATAQSKVAVAVTAARAAAPAKAMWAKKQCDIHALAPILDPDELMKKACQDALAVGFQKDSPHDAMGFQKDSPHEAFSGAATRTSSCGTPMSSCNASLGFGNK